MAATSEHFTHKGARAFGFSSIIEATKTRLSRHLLYRRTVNELSSLNASQLADLGLNRSMIRQVALQAVYDRTA